MIMKRFFNVILALFVFGFATANAELSEGAKAASDAIVELAKSTTSTDNDEAIEKLKAACAAYPDEAAQIVAAIIKALGGDEANVALVTRMLEAAIATLPDKTLEIAVAASAVAPALIADIRASDTGAFLADPLNTALQNQLITDSGNQIIFNTPNGISPP
jgi:hypothetical protein